MTVEPMTGPNPLFVWVRTAIPKLASIKAGNPRLEAEYLMAAALGKPRISLWLLDTPPAPQEIGRFESLLARRLAGEPLQYVLGTAEFAGLTLEVGPGVFIPRSETEVLVGHVETALRVRSGPGGGPLRIVDVGTGCGAILLALLHRIPGTAGVGLDRSVDALRWASRNAERLSLAGRCEFVQGDLLDCIGPDNCEAIVSNPPYIALREVDSLATEIRDHEPGAALFAGQDGLDVIRRLIPQAAARLVAGGLLALEIGITQAGAVRDLLADRDWREIEIRDDLAGRPRVVMARRGGSG
jgi:release factor glutamine methyltransferase